MAEHLNITVVLVEKELFGRTVLADLIEADPGFRVILAADPEMFVQESAGLLAPCIAVVAVGPAPQGMYAVEPVLVWMRENWPGTKVLVITCECGRDFLARCTCTGVRGYIQRGIHSSRDFLKALAELVSQGHSIPPDVIFAIAQLGQPSEDDRKEADLSRMEKKVLDTMCMPDNPTWPVVAERLHKSPKTVQTHCQGIYCTLAMHEKEAVKAWGRRRGFGCGRW